MEVVVEHVWVGQELTKSQIENQYQETLLQEWLVLKDTNNTKMCHTPKVVEDLCGMPGVGVQE